MKRLLSLLFTMLLITTSFAGASYHTSTYSNDQGGYGDTTALLSSNSFDTYIVDEEPERMRTGEGTNGVTTRYRVSNYDSYVGQSNIYDYDDYYDSLDYYYQRREDRRLRRYFDELDDDDRIVDTPLNTYPYFYYRSNYPAYSYYVRPHYYPTGAYYSYASWTPPIVYPYIQYYSFGTQTSYGRYPTVGGYFHAPYYVSTRGIVY